METKPGDAEAGKVTVVVTIGEFESGGAIAAGGLKIKLDAAAVFWSDVRPVLGAGS